MTYDITAIITAHAEGSMAHASIRSFEIAIKHSRSMGRSVQPLVMLDNPTNATTSLFESRRDDDWIVREVNYADQGLVRNEALALAEGKYVAFLDADDLWCENWLTAAYLYCENSDEDVIAHPEFNYFFEGQATIFEHLDMSDPDFDLDFLRIGNYWDALCFCARDIYMRLPFHVREIEKGYAYEDWYWNCQTTHSGMKHRIVRDTILFKRRRADSQTMKASANKSLPRFHGLSSYSSASYNETKR